MKATLRMEHFKAKWNHCAISMNVVFDQEKTTGGSSKFKWRNSNQIQKTCVCVCLMLTKHVKDFEPIWKIKKENYKGKNIKIKSEKLNPMKNSMDCITT